MPFTLVTRDEWGAAPCTATIPELKGPIMKVVMTKTRTEACSSDEECKEHMRKLQKFHIDQNHGDIPYNFVITPDAKVYEGRGWNQISPTPEARPELLNKTLVIGHIGEFQGSDSKRRWMIRATFDLIDWAIMNKIVDWEFKFMDIVPWINNVGYDTQLIE